MSIHWEESEDARGPVWLRFVECCHWGLFLTDVQIRWIWISGTKQMSNPGPAAELWGNLYASCFARNKHPKLWKAMANLPDEEKHQIDEEAERIIQSFIDQKVLCTFGPPANRKRRWILKFEDRDVADMHFDDEGEAMHAWNLAKDNWTCTLFVTAEFVKEKRSC